MSFDPFGDASTRGYLRNIHALPPGARLKDLEHQDFSAFLPDTLAWLATLEAPGYQDLLTVHRELFGGMYPWAGKDRLTLLPNKAISKGKTVFAVPQHIQKAFELGMDQRLTPGQTLGHWAYAHPFLDGNGRALFAFFDDYLARKGLYMDWPALEKSKFLRALDNQIAQPNSTVLDQLFRACLSPLCKHNRSNLLGMNWNSKINKRKDR